MESHIGYLALVALVFAWAAAGWVRDRWLASGSAERSSTTRVQRALSSVRPGRAIAVSALVLGLCWAPVAIDQVRGTHNLSQLASHFGSSDEAIATRAIDWLRDEKEGEAPFFLWLHMMDPHGPYFSAPEAARDQVPRDDGLPSKKLEPAKSNYGLGVLPKYQLLRSARDAKTYRWRYRAEVR